MRKIRTRRLRLFWAAWAYAYKRTGLRASVNYDPGWAVMRIDSAVLAGATYHVPRPNGIIPCMQGALRVTVKEVKPAAVFRKAVCVVLVPYASDVDFMRQLQHVCTEL